MAEKQVPLISKKVMTKARKIAAHAPKCVFSTPDGKMVLRAADLTDEKSVEKVLDFFFEADEDEQEEMLRSLLSSIKDLAEKRQWLAHMFVKIGGTLEALYPQLGVEQPD